MHTYHLPLCGSGVGMRDRSASARKNIQMEEEIYSTEFVENLFNRMSKTYGVVNYLSSFGFTERWRKQCIDEITWDNLREGYDLMSGMGETWGM